MKMKYMFFRVTVYLQSLFVNTKYKVSINWLHDCLNKMTYVTDEPLCNFRLWSAVFTHHGAWQTVTNIFEEPIVCMCTENSMPWSLTFHPEDENRMFLWNISASVQRLQGIISSELSQYSPPWGSNLFIPNLYIYLLLIFPKQNAILIWFPVRHYYKNSASINKYILNSTSTEHIDEIRWNSNWNAGANCSLSGRILSLTCCCWLWQ